MEMIFYSESAGSCLQHTGHGHNGFRSSKAVGAVTASVCPTSFSPKMRHHLIISIAPKVGGGQPHSSEQQHCSTWHLGMRSMGTQGSEKAFPTSVILRFYGAPAKPSVLPRTASWWPSWARSAAEQHWPGTSSSASLTPFSTWFRWS